MTIRASERLTQKKMHHKTYINGWAEHTQNDIYGVLGEVRFSNRSTWNQETIKQELRKWSKHFGKEEEYGALPAIIG